MSTGTVNRLTRLFSEYLRPRTVFFVDLVLSLLASALTVLLAQYVSSPGTYRLRVFFFWLLSAGIWSVVFFLITGSYRKVIRHTTMGDMSSFALIAFAKAAMTLITLEILGRVFKLFSVSQYLPLVLLIDSIVTFSLFAASRLAVVSVYQLFNQRLRSNRKILRVMVFGTGVKSIAAKTRLIHSNNYGVVGYISSDLSITHLKVNDAPLYKVESEEELKNLQNVNPFDGILFTSEGDLKEQKDKFVDWATSCGIKVLLAPVIDEVVGGKTKSQIREVCIEDLLGRDEIEISMDKIEEFVEDKVVLVTGAAGSIGSELCRQLSNFAIKKLVLFDNAETPMHNLRLELEEKYPSLDFFPIIGDVRSPARVDYVFRKWSPDIVLHAAAYKHVPLMEENPCEAVRVNLFGTRTVADKCIEYGVSKMVMISTDKAVNPTNIMGCSKRLAEIYVQSLGKAIMNGKVEGKTRFVTTRFGNVLGSNGSVIPRFRQQIAQGGPLTVTDPNINRFFMTIPEACRLVMEAAALSRGNDIYVFDMGEPVKIDTLARRMITLAGFEPGKDIDIVYTGLRPGEKLYEEVLATEENTSPSFHDRIRVAHVREYEYEELIPVFDKLADLAVSVDIPEMVKLMKTTVPEFKSKNSVFEQYDK